MPPLTQSCLEALVETVKFELYNSGEWVLHKGMLTESFYVIALGTAQILLDEKAGVVISILTKGDCFGGTPKRAITAPRL